MRCVAAPAVVSHEYIADNKEREKTKKNQEEEHDAEVERESKSAHDCE